MRSILALLLTTFCLAPAFGADPNGLESLRKAAADSSGLEALKAACCKAEGKCACSCPTGGFCPCESCECIARTRAEADCAHFTIYVPPNSQLYINDQRMPDREGIRTFVSPPLPRGATCYYDVRLVTPNGVQTKRVQLRSGEQAAASQSVSYAAPQMAYYQSQMMGGFGGGACVGGS